MFFFLAGLDELIQLEMAEDPSGLHAALESTSEDEHITPIFDSNTHKRKVFCQSCRFQLLSLAGDVHKFHGGEKNIQFTPLYFLFLFLYRFQPRLNYLVYSSVVMDAR